MDDIAATVGRLAAHWELNSALSNGLLKQVRDALAPTLTVRPLAREIAEDVGDRLLQLTRMQIAVLSAMRRQRRLIVYGAAGTGKTVLAVERARQLAEDGFEVLLTCFNRPLGRHIARQFEGDARVRGGSFASLCRDLAVAAGASIPERPSEEWWDQLAAQAPTYAEAVGYHASAIVVDEGQDFAPEWWDTLELLTQNPEEDPFYVFADAAQQLYRGGWRPPFEEPRADLDINCRNTMEIAERVAAVYGTDIPTLGTNGPRPEFIKVKSIASAKDKLETLLDRLLKQEKLAPSQLAILSSSRDIVNTLQGASVAGHRLTASDADDGVPVETIQRFKGLEADVVILVIPELEDDADRVLAYVGMSRARVLLIVVGTSPVRAALSWP
jgi:superfamily I DNA and RNA helicase